MMNFVTIFPETENIHLIKDVGMIPYIMYKEYGIDSKIVCYKNGDYPYLNSDVKGLKIDFIKKFTGKSILDVGIYLLKKSKKIDVLHIFHLGIKESVWICVYKFLNKKGKIYLKFDADYHIKETTNPRGKSLKAFLKKLTLNKCDLISVENRVVYSFLKEFWKIDVKYIPNGFYDYKRKTVVCSGIKEKTILTVGRIGTYQKATEILLEGFKMAYKNDTMTDWNLKIVGPIEKSFKGYVDKFINENPNLKRKIEFTGAIYDRDELKKEYEKAKIFCLTSRYESFGLVFLEAMKAGCYIISSDVESALDITNNRTYGSIFKIDDIEELSQCIVKSCNNESLNSNCYKIQEYVYKEFYWTTICKKILIYLFDESEYKKFLV